MTKLEDLTVILAHFPAALMHGMVLLCRSLFFRKMLPVLLRTSNARSYMMKKIISSNSLPQKTGANPENMSKVMIESKNNIFNFNDMYIFYDNNPGHLSWDEHRRRAARSQQLR
jgi:hypothetical protein